MAKTAIRIGCPKHGLLHSPVEYASFKVGKYDITDVPCVFCKECACYYSTSMSLTILTYPEMKGRELRKGISVRVSKDQKKPMKRANVQERKQSISRQSEIQHAQRQPANNQKKNTKPYQQDFTGPTITTKTILLSNSPRFLSEKRCPKCAERVVKKNVRVRSDHEYRHGYKYWLTDKLLYCPKCDSYYISPESLKRLNDKILSKINEALFVWPTNVEYIETEGDTEYYITKSMFLEKGQDEFYEMSVEEIAYMSRPVPITRYGKDSFEADIPFKAKSILGEHGYSVNRSPAMRRDCLRNCVDAYGKDRVITQIKFNIRMREAQKDKTKYAHAIGVWQTDIEFVETLEDTWAIRQEEEAKRRREEFEESYRRYQEERTQQRKEEKREWAWWEHRE